METTKLKMVVLRIYWVVSIICLASYFLFPKAIDFWLMHEFFFAFTQDIQTDAFPILIVAMPYIFFKNLSKIKRLRTEKTKIPTIYMVDGILSLIHSIILILFYFSFH
ncbi:MAG: hypothetical protein Q4A78_04855 [Peptostreptococcaceae bacterium]|nr:hypothetical protein [Peptostreptococcaceae bacterium]